MNGLAALGGEVELVAIHDGARPLIDARMTRATLAACADADGALLAVPTHDSLRRVRDGLVIEEVPREELWRAQTPQSFRLEVIRAAHQRAAREGWQVSDDAALVLRCGGRVRVVPGSATNIKVTDPDDLRFADALLRERA
jgi:2-C-methyl-D-erythritol 4-phosphate cytidylyltransferase